VLLLREAQGCAPPTKKSDDSAEEGEAALVPRKPAFAGGGMHLQTPRHIRSKRSAAAGGKRSPAGTARWQRGFFAPRFFLPPYPARVFAAVATSQVCFVDDARAQRTAWCEEDMAER